MKASVDLLSQVEPRIEEFFKENISKDFVYHNFTHTLQMVDAAKLIAKAEGLNRHQKDIVILASWFHDTGYNQGCDGHEDRSIEFLRSFGEEVELDQEMLERAAGCIKATQMPQNPTCLEEKVTCDADLYHLSTEEFFVRSSLLRTELNNTCDKPIEQMEWLEKNEAFLNSHTYFTDYGKTKLEPGKQKNLEKLKGRKKKLKKRQKKVAGLEESIKTLNKKISGVSELKPDRGIETMFRLTSKNHLDLSAMADNKANIMISINSIVLSVVVSVLIRKVEESPFLLIPTLLLTTVCLATIVLAILSTIPNISSGKFKRQDILNRETNLLFFGNFHKMPLEDFEWGMKQMMKDGDYLYGSLIKDIYYLGAVLGKKYKLLRVSYTIFMFGFVGAILSFILFYALK